MKYTGVFYQTIFIFFAIAVLYVYWVPIVNAADAVTNICNVGTNVNGVTGGPACEGPCWSDNGQEGFCQDPSISGYDTYIDIQACDTDNSHWERCDSRDGGNGIGNVNNNGQILSTNSYKNGHCKIQFDIYKDDGSGRIGPIGFLVFRNPDLCPIVAVKDCEPITLVDDSGNSFNWNEDTWYSWHASSIQGLTWVDPYYNPSSSVSWNPGPITGRFNWHYTTYIGDPGSYTLGFAGLGNHDQRCWAERTVVVSANTPPPTCSISASGGTTAFVDVPKSFTVGSANANDVGLYRSPTAAECWRQNIPGCSGAVVDGLPGTQTSGTGSVTFSDPGQYYAVCNAYRPPYQCTGNPFGFGAGWSNCSTVACGSLGSDCVVIDVTNQLGTITASTEVTTNALPDCSSSTTNISSGQIKLTGSNPVPAPTTKPSVANWINVIAGSGVTYNVSPTVNANYASPIICLNGAPGSADAALTFDGQTLTWKFIYAPPGPWVQTGGGDVYAFNRLATSMPFGLTAVPSHFNRNGNSGLPGIVLYGQPSSNPDFSLAAGNNLQIDVDSDGDLDNLVSARQWLTQDNLTPNPPTPDFFESFWRAFGSPTAETTIGADDPLNGTYYTKGSGGIVVTSGIWDIVSGQIVAILVDGRFDINTPINIDEGGFLAVIARNGINVTSSVGSTEGDETADIEGIFITDTAFNTGTSVAAIPKLVGAGMFIAGSFNLQRNLGSVNVNQPAELFIYRPDFLITMPEEMRETLLQWQEINP